MQKNRTILMNVLIAIGVTLTIVLCVFYQHKQALGNAHETGSVIGSIPMGTFQIPVTDRTIPVVIIAAVIVSTTMNVYCFRRSMQIRSDAQKMTREHISIADVLSHEFQTLWLIDNRKRECRFYSGADNEVKELQENGIALSGKYSKFIRRYTDIFISEKERKSIRECVMQKDFFYHLPDDGSFYCLNFTGNKDNEIRHFQMCFAKSVHLSGDADIILGFRNTDEIIEKEMRQNKLLQDALNQAEAANVAKTTFLSNISQDIRTPMNEIIEMTALAATYIDDRECVTECLHKVTASSKQLLGQMNEVLDMSKIESGKVDLVEKEFNFLELFDKLLAMSRQQIKEHRHEITVAVSHIIHEKVIGDSQRIEQVFMNLMSNAVKYTPEGGKITVTLSEKKTCRRNAAFYEIIFEDNGVGMPQDFLQKIFDPFARNEAGQVSKIQGTGLGMSIVRNIAHMMGGDLKVESEDGKGSKCTVTFFLKLQKAEDVNYEEAVELPVLVVDDDRMECEAVCEILDKMGMRSEGVLSDKEAIERIKKHRETLNDFLAVIDRTRVKKANGEALLKKFPQMNLKGKRALVVEDNELNAEIAKETLEKTGVEVECAENGAKAIDKIASRDNGYYDIVFMDIQMPVMDGEAATRAIRAMGREYTDALPVIAMTANALSEDVHAAKAAGMNGYISKPLELDILADMLYKWLIFGNQELHRAQAL